MRTTDLLRFARDAATGNPLRTGLMVLAMGIGVAAVVTLTALGDGARRYVIGQFSAIGTNLVIVFPGRSQTGGLSPASAVTSTPRDLTVDDAQSLRRLPGVVRVAPLAVGSAELNTAGRLRETVVVGTTADYLPLRQLTMQRGRFITGDDGRHAAPEVVLGATLQRELFDGADAVGQHVRLGGRRLLVVGVMAPSGTGLGMNSDEMAMVPVALAQSLFNSSTLLRVLIEASSRDAIEGVKTRATGLLKERHEGEEDVTVITQDAVLQTFDRVLVALTLAVAGIAAISLAVAGILVMNVMLVSVSQRTPEVGLLKALGADAATIRNVFLAEAVLLSVTGALLGYAVGQAGAAVVRWLWPAFDAWPPTWAVLAALGTALGTGVLFGVLPARRAAALDPVQALGRR